MLTSILLVLERDIWNEIHFKHMWIKRFAHVTDMTDICN